MYSYIYTYVCSHIYMCMYKYKCICLFLSLFLSFSLLEDTFAASRVGPFMYAYLYINYVHTYAHISSNAYIHYTLLVCSTARRTYCT